MTLVSVCVFLFVMIRLPPRATRTYTLFPYSTLFRSIVVMTAGGTAVSGEIDFATPYLKHILGFIGIENVTFIAADRLMMNGAVRLALAHRSEEHTSELQSLMRISYAVFCLKKKKR